MQVTLAALSKSEVRDFRIEVANRMKFEWWTQYVPDDYEVEYFVC